MQLHERFDDRYLLQTLLHSWGIIASVIGISRLAVQECFKWAMQRKVFSKRLIDQPVIRNKLARMVT